MSFLYHRLPRRRGRDENCPWVMSIKTRVLELYTLNWSVLYGNQVNVTFIFEFKINRLKACNTAKKEFTGTTRTQILSPAKVALILTPVLTPGMLTFNIAIIVNMFEIFHDRRLTA